MSSWCLKCFFFLLIDIIWKLSLFFSNLIFCWESMCCFYLRGYLCVFLGVLALLSSYCLNLFYMFLNSKNLFAIILISNRKQIISYWIKLGYSASDHMCVHIYIYIIFCPQFAKIWNQHKCFCFSEHLYVCHKHFCISLGCAETNKNTIGRVYVETVRCSKCDWMHCAKQLRTFLEI